MNHDFRKIAEIPTIELQSKLSKLVVDLFKDFDQATTTDKTSYIVERISEIIGKRFANLSFCEVAKLFEEISFGSIKVVKITANSIVSVIEQYYKDLLKRGAIKSHYETIKQELSDGEKRKIFVDCINARLENYYNNGVEYFDINNNLYNELVELGYIDELDYLQYLEHAKNGATSKKTIYGISFSDNSVENEAKKLFIKDYLSKNRISLLC